MKLLISAKFCLKVLDSSGDLSEMELGLAAWRRAIVGAYSAVADIVNGSGGGDDDGDTSNRVDHRLVLRDPSRDAIPNRRVGDANGGSRRNRRRE